MFGLAVTTIAQEGRVRQTREAASTTESAKSRVNSRRRSSRWSETPWRVLGPANTSARCGGRLSEWRSRSRARPSGRAMSATSVRGIRVGARPQSAARRKMRARAALAAMTQ